MTRITERLNEAERRALDASAQGAKSYASTARNIAYLEGKVYNIGLLSILTFHIL